MHGVIVAVLLAAAPTPIKVAAPTLNFVNVDEKTGELYLDYFAQQLAMQPGFQVTTRGQMNALLGLERQKDLLGCSASSCTAELAGALGVDAVVTGSLGKSENGYVLSMSIIGAKDAHPLAIFSSRPKNEDKLYDDLSAFARTAAEKLRAQLQPELAVQLPHAQTTQTQNTVTPPVETRPTPETTPTTEVTTGATAEAPADRAWIGAAAVGAVAAGGAVAMFVKANGDHTALETGDFPATDRADVAAFRRQGESEQAISAALAASGALALGTAGAMAALPKDNAVRKFSPFIAGGVALIGGGVLYGLAASDKSQLESGTNLQQYADVENVRARGEARQAAAFTLGAAGIVGVAAGTVLLLTQSDAAPPVAVMVQPNGAFASVQGRF